MKGHRVWAEIDLSAIRHNVGVVRRAVGPWPRLMAVVKADGYGHGAITMASAALSAGCSVLGVNDLGEALELRRNGLLCPILVLGPAFEDEIPDAVEHGLTLTLHSDDTLDLLDEESRRRRRIVRVHLEVDTGMNRLGVSADRALEIAWNVSERRHLILEGVFTHFSSAVSGDATITRGQLDRFSAVLAELDHAGLRPPVVHAANSAALFTVPESRHDLVRPGIALYGMDPGLFARMGLNLRPVLSLKTQIVQLRRIPAGATVGYEQTYRARRDTVIATCPVGYEDGYPWPLSNRGTVLVRGRRAPVAGRASMNYLTIDAGGLPDVEVGDVVTLIGRDGDEEIRVEELAREIGTIPYEVTCRLGRRVKRVPVGDAVSSGLRVAV